MRVSPQHCFILLLACVALVACASDPPTHTPTPAVSLRVSTPFAAFAAATPPARLHERPGEAPGATLERGADLSVEDIATAPDGQVWYRVSTTTGERGWLPADAVSLVGRPAAVAPAPLPTLTPMPSPSATPAPRPLVITGSGQGLFLRARPGQGEIIRSYPDGTAVTPLGDETEVDGRRWLRVRAPDGREGWMAAEYLRPA